jgi:hypothetical protein
LKFVLSIIIKNLETKSTVQKTLNPLFGSKAFVTPPLPSSSASGLKTTLNLMLICKQSGASLQVYDTNRVKI